LVAAPINIWTVAMQDESIRTYGVRMSSGKVHRVIEADANFLLEMLQHGVADFPVYASSTYVIKGDPFVELRISQIESVESIAGDALYV
jgi:hypothetical protein